jgi:hypothetical protein
MGDTGLDDPGAGKAFALQAGVGLVDHVVSAESVFMVT